MQERFKVNILGFEIGTASGWDQMDICVNFFYDFKPNEGIDIIGDGINIQFDTGVIEAFDDEGNEIAKYDAFTILKNSLPS